MSDLSSGRSSRTFPLVVAGIVAALFVAHTAAEQRSRFQQVWDSGAPVRLTGELTVLYADDFANGRSELVHNVRDERTGRWFRLRFERAAPSDLRSGMRVAVHGRAHGGDVYVDSSGNNEPVVLALDPSASLHTSGASGPSASIVSGNQQTLVIVANFRDAVVRPFRPGGDCSMQAISDIMFTHPGGYSVDALYRDMSAGQLSFSGRVAGPYTLDAASTDACANNSWAAAADALAAADGIDPAPYARKVYVLPPSTCPAAGMGDLGVTPSRAWVFTCDIAHVYAHELGHNIGMHHAATETSEYGDNSDIMGMQGGLMPVNAPHKSQMGWLRDASLAEVTEGGTYEVAPLALPAALATAPQALKLRRPDSNDYYYVSYRHGTGFEGNACCQYLDRLNVHRWAGGGDRTYLLATLADGESYVDPANGFRVTQLSHSSGSAVAHIQPGTSCGATAPTLYMSPRDRTGGPGTTATYDVMLVNEDAPACSPSTFVLQPLVPSGWSSNLSAPSLQLTPGSMGQVALSVSVPSSAPPGTHSLAVSVTDAKIPAHAASTAGSYTVVRPCSSTPAAAFTPVTQSAPAGASLKYSLAITNRDGTDCGLTTFAVTAAVPAGWYVTPSTSKLSLPPGSTGTVSYSVASPSDARSGSYAISAHVTSGSGSVHTATADASYVVVIGDTTPPTAPTGLTALIRKTQASLAWQPSVDEVGVAGYRIWRNGSLVGTATGTNWTDQPLAAGSYTYVVDAYDTARNISAASGEAIVKVNAAAKGK